jgi:hypothetical protein
MSKEKVFATDSWVGSAQGGDGGPDDSLLIQNRDQVEILAEVDDPNRDYEFDCMAVCYLKGHGYFIVQATGCSCPSPSETWTVVHRFRTKSQVMKAIEDGEYKGYTLPSYAILDLRRELGLTP